MANTMSEHLTPEEEAALDKIADKMANCGLIDNIARGTRIHFDIKALEEKARANRPEYAPRNAPLERFLSPEDAIELRSLKIERVIVEESEKKSSKCFHEDRELDDLLVRSGLFKIAVVKSVTTVGNRTRIDLEQEKGEKR